MCGHEGDRQTASVYLRVDLSVTHQRRQPAVSIISVREDSDLLRQSAPVSEEA